MIRRLLHPMVDVREGEGLLAFLMAALYFLLLVTYYLLKPARDSLFLTQVGPEQLPVVFVLIAIVAHPVVTLHARAARRLSLKHLLYGATVVLAASLVALWFLLMVDGAALLYVVYVWVSIYGALTVSQFWLLANRVFNAAQAKRLFTLLNTGAMLGAFFGGEVANGLVEFTGLRTADLLLVAAAVLVGSLVLVGWVLRRSRPAPDHPVQEGAEVPEDEDGFRALVQTIRGSRLLVFIVALIALEMMTSTFVDYQFKTVATRYFGEEERLTGFLATFYGRVSLIALAVQVVVLPRLLTRFGVGSALLVMPVSLLLGTAGVLIVPGIVTVTLLRGADQTFEHSADKVGRELLFLPIPMQVKRRVKVFIDVFVDRVFRGLAGVLLLGLTLWLGLGPRGLSVVVLGLLAAWITTAFFAQRSYVVAFREALREGQLEMKRTWTRTTSVGHALSTLQDGLATADDPKILFALQALAERNDERIVEAVRPLLSYPARDVRRHALRALRAQPSAPPLPEARQHLLDEDAGIQQEAFHYQFLDREGGVTLLQDFLDEASPSLQAAAAACAVRFGTDEHTACLGRAAIDTLLHHDDPALRAALAEVLARSDEAVQTYLADLARDDDPEVRRAAVRSMGIVQHDDFVPILIYRLRDDPVHVEAWNALSRYGDAILDDLIAVFEDPDTSALVRRRLPRVLSAIPEQRSVDLLMSRLQCTDPVLRHNVTTALHRLRLDEPDVDIPQEPVEDALRREAGIYYRIAQSIQWAKGDAAQDALQSVPLPEEVPPLDELLDDHLDRSAKRIFYLLGLYCPEHAVRHAYTAYTSEQEHLRALAVEWLNSVLDYDLRQLLGPIIDPPSFAATARAGERLLGEQVESLEGVLQVLIDGPDPRLQACAFYHAAAAPTTPLIDRAREAVDDVDERVRKAAAWMLEHVSAPAQ